VGIVIQLSMGTPPTESLDQGKRRSGRCPACGAWGVLVRIWFAWVFSQEHSEGALIFEEIKLLTLVEKKEIIKARY
jgi:hypothetical protein